VYCFWVCLFAIVQHAELVKKHPLRVQAFSLSAWRRSAGLPSPEGNCMRAEYCCLTLKHHSLRPVVWNAWAACTGGYSIGFRTLYLWETLSTPERTGTMANICKNVLQPFSSFYVAITRANLESWAILA
jgi:hypothetical protein